MPVVSLASVPKITILANSFGSKLLQLTDPTGTKLYFQFPNETHCLAGLISLGASFMLTEYQDDSPSTALLAYYHKLFLPKVQRNRFQHKDWKFRYCQTARHEEVFVLNSDCKYRLEWLHDTHHEFIVFQQYLDSFTKDFPEIGQLLTLAPECK